jgi:hypothetical protein
LWEFVLQALSTHAEDKYWRSVIAALFVAAKNWKQLKCPSAEY